MSTPLFARNICIGLIDGIIIPLALASGLSMLVHSSRTVLLAGIAAAVAGAITMSIGGFFEARKYEPANAPASSSITIGISYLTGGLVVSLPYFFIATPMHALPWAAALAALILPVAGYTESALHGGSGWRGAVRVVFMGMAAAIAACLISMLFR